MRPTASKPDTDTASPDEARAIMVRLAALCDEQPTFTLPNVRDRMLWEQEQARTGKAQRKLEF